MAQDMTAARIQAKDIAGTVYRILRAVDESEQVLPEMGEQDTERLSAYEFTEPAPNSRCFYLAHAIDGTRYRVTVKPVREHDADGDD